MKFALSLLAVIVAVEARFNELVVLPGHDTKERVLNKRPHEYVEDVPKAFDWGNAKGGRNFLTKNLNQHIPQYCGSCWAHGTVSSLGDRIKIARDGKGFDINLAVQFILNCGKGVAGSCHGGSHTGAHQFIYDTGYIPYDTCLPYMACSSESQEGFCPENNFECNAINTCRTCSTYAANGGKCVGLDVFPNASIAEYGVVNGTEKMMKEIYARGPIPCSVNADPLDNYTGGIVDNPTAKKETNHVISIVGWGYNEKDGSQYWIARNSWGEYWGEMGFFRLKLGENQLGIESDCSWAVPKSFTELNHPCYEDGSNCVSHKEYTQLEIPLAEQLSP